MKKIKILQVGLSYKAGGIESFLMSYQSNMDLKKIRMDFINVFDEAINEEFYSKLNQKGKMYNLSNYRKYPIKFLKELKKIQESEKYDIFHYNMNSACYLFPLIAAKIAGFKNIIAHSHNSSSDKGIIKNIIHNINKIFIPLFANKYFACSQTAGRWFFSKKILNSENFFIINNAIDTKKYKFNDKIRKEKRKSLKISDETVVIGHVGRFKKQKNHEFLIEIFETYSKKYKKCILLLVGFGPLEGHIKEIVRNKKIENSVIFLGERNDVEELMQAMDVFILPSLYEGLPIVGIEAQISGLPCIFSDTITDELKITESAKFVSLHDSSQVWAENINQIVKNNKQRIDINSDDFDIKINAKRLEKIYEEIIFNQNGGKM